MLRMKAVIECEIGRHSEKAQLPLLGMRVSSAQWKGLVLSYSNTIIFVFAIVMKVLSHFIIRQIAPSLYINQFHCSHDNL